MPSGLFRVEDVEEKAAGLQLLGRQEEGPGDVRVGETGTIQQLGRKEVRTTFKIIAVEIDAVMTVHI